MCKLKLGILINSVGSEGTGTVEGAVEVVGVEANDDDWDALGSVGSRVASEDPPRLGKGATPASERRVSLEELLAVALVAPPPNGSTLPKSNCNESNNCVVFPLLKACEVEVAAAPKVVRGKFGCCPKRLAGNELLVGLC